MAYTSDDILSDAKLRAYFAGTALSDSDILRLANDELLGILTARQMASAQGLLGVETSTALVAGQIRYDIPYRAAGGKLRYVCLVDALGNRCSLSQGRPERFVKDYNLTTQAPMPSDCWFEDGRVVVFPAPQSSAYSLLMGMYIRPNRMVLAASSTTASAAAAAGASTISMAAAPAYLNGTATVDIISAKPPFQVLAYDLAVSSISTGNTTLTITTPANLLYAVPAGSYITKVEESVVPQLPAEGHPLLAARTAKRILQARGDLTNLQAVNADIEELEANFFEFMSNRNEAQIDTLGASPLLGLGARWAPGVGSW